MSKQFVDELISHMRLAGIVTKAAPWMFEGMGDKAMSVRYIGIRVTKEWEEVFSANNNLLLKFVIDRNSAHLELYLANKAPFLKIMSSRFSDSDKWETLLGEFRRRLKKDKADVTNHSEQVGNLYTKIQGLLKK